MSTIFDAVREKEPILFIGAGFSRCLDLPDWKELVLEIIDLCEKNEVIKQGNKELVNTNRKDLLLAFDEYEKDKRDIYAEIIKKKLQIPDNHDGLKRVEKLWKISDKIITTNYDKALEITGKKNKATIENNANFELASLQNETNYVLNLHGSIDNAESCVLFTSDYKKIYDGDTLVKNVFENIIKNNTLIFIGFSMTDPYVNTIFEKINSIYKGYLINHFIITTDNNTDFSKFNLKAHNVNNWGDQFEDLLDKLIETKENKKVEVIITEPEKIIIAPYKPVNTLNIYPRLDSLFTGREKEQALFKTAFANHRVFAIEGLGGFGKTEFAAKCIDAYIDNKDNIIWLNGNEDDKFDSFIENIGYGEILKSELKTQQAIFSSLYSLIERDKKIIFLDNFQAIKSEQFLKFIEYAQQILKESTIIIISKKDISVKGTSPHVVSIGGLDNALNYAQKIKNSEEKFKDITDADLELLVANTLNHPLAIKLCIPLLKKGIKAEDLIKKIVEYKGQGVNEVEELTKRIFDEVYHHESTTEEEKTLLKSIAAFNGFIKKDAIDFLMGADQFVYLSRLQDNFLVSIEQDNYKLHPLIKELAYNILENKIEVHAKAAEYFLVERKDNLDINLEENIFYHLGKSEQWEKVNTEIDKRGRDLLLKGNYEIIKEFVDKLKEVEIENPLFDIFLGDIEEINGDYTKATDYYKKAAEQEKNKKVRAEGILKLGEMFYYTGQINDALFNFKIVLAIAKSENFKELEVNSLTNIGATYESLEKFNDSYEYYIDAIRISNDIQNKFLLATGLNGLANLYSSQRKYQDAIKMYEESILIKKEIGNQSGIAASLGNLGVVYGDCNEIEKAFECHNESMRMSIAIGNKQGIGATYGNIGILYENKGDYENAMNYLEDSLRIFVEMGYQDGISTVYHNIGRVFSLKKVPNFKKAIETFFKSIIISKKIGIPCISTFSHVNNIRTKQLKEKFKPLAYEVYNEFSEEDKAFIDIRNICREEIKSTTPARNAPCPCGKGKQYKRCCGK
jgi:tetratricopeptide (TPR) repeat protein